MYIHRSFLNIKEKYNATMPFNAALDISRTLENMDISGSVFVVLVHAPQGGYLKSICETDPSGRSGFMQDEAWNNSYHASERCPYLCYWRKGKKLKMRTMKSRLIKKYDALVAELEGKEKLDNTTKKFRARALVRFGD